ncbi:MAG: hypothetical protein ACR2HH_01290 [Chthoniobacterales bacterium]
MLISAAQSSAANPDGTEVSGNYTGGAGTLEFFASPSGDLSGFGEGQYFVGSIAVVAAGSFTAHLSAIVPTGYAIAATATSSNGNTSEFSGTTIVPPPSDSDGLPDQWMLAHFGHVTPLTGEHANEDKDGDGFTNLQEFRAGTNPNSVTGRFQFTAIARSGNDRVLAFASVAGKTYRIDYKDDLLAATWILLEDQVSAIGSSTQITDSGAGPRRFYRTVIEP